MRLSLIVSFCIVVLLNIFCCIPYSHEKLMVDPYPQRTSVWCWAASAQMVMNYLGHNINQCEQVNDDLRQNNLVQGANCCTNPTPQICFQTGWPQFGNYGFKYNTTKDSALTWANVKKQLSGGPCCRKRPFCCTWYWLADDGTFSGGGHMMVVIGYKTFQNSKYVHILDPAPVDEGTYRLLPYKQYVSGNDHAHWDDFYDIEYIGGD
jgi:hypothetical protein